MKKLTIQVIANLSLLLLIASMALGGFLLHQLWWEKHITQQAQSHLHQLLTHTHQWTHPTPVGDPTDIPVVDGESFAVITNDTIGLHHTITQGVSKEDLALGPGHFPETALPGKVGNFSLAGHRIGKGGAFQHIGDLKTCDPVTVETSTATFTYRVVGHGDCFTPEQISIQDRDHVTGISIITPDQYEVTAPIPHEDADNPPHNPPEGKYMTLVTCNPEWGNWERLVVHLQMTDMTVKGQQ